MKLKPSEIADTICQIIADQHEVTLEDMGGRHHSSAIWAVGKAKEIRERSLSIK